MKRWGNFTLILDNKWYDVRFALFEVLTSGFEYAFGLFETQTVQNCKVVLDYLLSAMPYSSFWWCKADILTLHQINIANWTDIDKILKPNITEPQSLDLKTNPFAILDVIESNKGVLQTSFIYFLLCLLLIIDMLYDPRLLQKVVIEVSLQHKIVFVYLLQLPH